MRNEWFNSPSSGKNSTPNIAHTFRTSGTGPLYFGAEARFVSLEEPVKAAGNELFVRRDYYRLAPKPTLIFSNGFE